VADIGDLIKEMRNNAQNIRYADACKVADAFFGKPRQRGTSHRIWKMAWAGDPRVNLQEGDGGKAKAYQVDQLLKALDRLSAERAAGKKAQAVEKEEKTGKKRTKGKKR
jgi:hypothetical protein